jgi:alpha-D-ribose 1-methylphosphonate 5-triphosphate synthase subunit PhnH
MKRLTILLTLLATLTLALSAGKTPGATHSATIIVSCSVCTVGEPMTVTGSGYAARRNVAINVSGPNYLSMSVTADNRGNISVYYPTGMELTNVYYPTGMEFGSGYYTIAASQSGGASAITGFEIQ